MKITKKEYTETCPRCNSLLKGKRWCDEVGLVEMKKECSCGYVKHWAYGRTITDIDNYGEVHNDE